MVAHDIITGSGHPGVIITLWQQDNLVLRHGHPSLHKYMSILITAPTTTIVDKHSLVVSPNYKARLCIFIHDSSTQMGNTHQSDKPLYAKQQDYEPDLDYKQVKFNFVIRNGQGLSDI